MNSIIKIFLALFSINILCLSQTQPGFSSSVFITDGEAIPRKLTFGLDPLASDGIDTLFGESDLPPLPPPGGFDARLNLPIDNFSGLNSSWIDIRQATFPFTGQKEFRLRYQPGIGAAIKIIWNFPSQVTGRLQDVVLGSLIDVTMTGQDSFVVTNPIAFDRLKMTINFNNVVSSVEDENLPQNYYLSQNYPNPFNPSTFIEYSLAKDGFVRLSVFNINGEKVTDLIKEYQLAGKYKVLFDAGKITSGVYFYSINTEDFSAVKKMILIR